MTPPLFLYDVGSPYAWLAAERVDEVFPEPVEWRPVLLGAIFQARDRGSWARTDARAEGMAEVQRRAAAYGLPPVRWPEGWPGDGLHAMRAATYATQRGRGREYALAALRLAFTEGYDLSDPAGFLEAAEQAGLAPAEVEAAIATPEVKDALRAATDDALARGVVGVPTVVVGDAVFWGEDRLDEAAASARAG